VKIEVIYGPPGTGKTTYAIEVLRASLQEGKGVSYDTFRRSMAEDARMRVLSEVGFVSRHYISTTHAICYHLLELSHDQVLRYKDFKKFCEQNHLSITPSEFSCSLSPPLEEDFYDTSGGAFLSLYNNCRNCLIPFDEFQRLPPYMLPSSSSSFNLHLLFSRFPKLAKRYDEFKKEHKKIDFSDMLYRVYEEELSPNSDIHIADEFHDKTPLQYQIFKIWVRNSERVYCCLDFNQRIYSFWGTNLTPIEELHQNPTRILQESYRLSPSQYEYARKVLRPQTAPDIECKNEVEIEETVAPLPHLKSLVSKTSSILLLGRTKYHLYYIAKMLNDAGIPFVGDRRFSLSKNDVFLLRSLRKIERAPLTVLLDALTADAFTEQKKKLKEKVEKKGEIYAFPYLSREFLESLKKPEKLPKFIRRSFTKNSQRIAKLLHSPYHEVKLLTIHGAKGLEADYVFLFDGISPRIFSTISHYKEEKLNEKRVWYVGVTRARKKLFIVRNFFPSALSHSILPPLEK